MNYRGVIYTVLSSLAFGILPIFVRMAYSTGLNPYNVLFVRFIFASAFLLIYLLYRHVDLRLSKKQFFTIAFVAVVGYMGTSLTLFIAYQILGAGLTTAIHFAYPIFVTVISVLIYKERLTSAKKTALFLSVGGIFLLSMSGTSMVNIGGFLIAILSAVLFALYVLGIAKRELEKLNSIVLIFYVCLFSGIGSFFLEVLRGDWAWKITTAGVLYMVLISIFCTAAALILFAKGIKMIGPTSASILSTLEPNVSIIAGFLVLGEPLSWQMISGIILVIISVLLITMSSGKPEYSEIKASS